VAGSRSIGVILDEVYDCNVLLAVAFRLHRYQVGNRRSGRTEQLQRIGIVARDAAQKRLEPAISKSPGCIREIAGIVNFVHVAAAASDVNSQPLDRFTRQIDDGSCDALPVAALFTRM